MLSQFSHAYTVPKIVLFTIPAEAYALYNLELQELPRKQVES